MCLSIKRLMVYLTVILLIALGVFCLPDLCQCIYIPITNAIRSVLHFLHIHHNFDGILRGNEI